MNLPRGVRERPVLGHIRTDRREDWEDWADWADWAYRVDTTDGTEVAEVVGLAGVAGLTDWSRRGRWHGFPFAHRKFTLAPQNDSLGKE
jgi:hypothetical protein